jgi:hypothetical protein
MVRQRRAHPAVVETFVVLFFEGFPGPAEERGLPRR